MSKVLEECYNKFDREKIRVSQPPKPRTLDPNAPTWDEKLAKLIKCSETISRRALVEKGILWHNRSYLDIMNPNVSVSNDRVKEAVRTAMQEIYSLASKYFWRISHDLRCICSEEMKQSTKSYQDLYLTAKGKADELKRLEDQLKAAQQFEQSLRSAKKK